MEAAGASPLSHDELCSSPLPPAPLPIIAADSAAPDPRDGGGGRGRRGRATSMDIAVRAVGAAASTYKLTSTILGAGLLSLPIAFKSSGILAGFALLALHASFAAFGCSLVLKAYQLTGKRSYDELAAHLFEGTFVTRLAQIGIMLLNVGACAAYMNVVRSLLPPSMCSLFPQSLSELCKHSEYEDLIVGALVVFIVFPLCLRKDLSALRHTSLLAFLFCVFLTGSVVARTIPFIGDGPRHKDACEPVLLVNTKSPMEIFRAIPLFSFAFICHLNVLPVYDELRKRSPSKMQRVFGSAIAFAAVLYGLVGTFGYMRFCDHTPGNILEFAEQAKKANEATFPADDRLITAARIAETLTCILALPLIEHPTKLALHNFLTTTVAGHMLRRKHIESRIAVWGEVFVILGTAYALAIAVPQVEVIFGLLGSTLCSLICFIFPGIFYLKARKVALTNGIPENASYPDLTRLLLHGNRRNDEEMRLPAQGTAHLSADRPKWGLIEYFAAGLAAYGVVMGVVGTLVTALHVGE